MATSSVKSGKRPAVSSGSAVTVSKNAVTAPHSRPSTMIGPRDARPVPGANHGGRAVWLEPDHSGGPRAQHASGFARHRAEHLGRRDPASDERRDPAPGGLLVRDAAQLVPVGFQRVGHGQAASLRSGVFRQTEEPPDAGG